MTHSGEVRKELDEHADVMKRVAEGMTDDLSDLVTLVLATLRGGGKLLFCGNGGSAALPSGGRVGSSKPGR